MSIFKVRLFFFHVCFASLTFGILLQQAWHFAFFLISLGALFFTGVSWEAILGKGKRAAALLMGAILLSAVIAQLRLKTTVDFEYHWAFLAFWLVTPALVEKTNWNTVHRLMLILSVPGLIYSYYWMIRPDEIAWALEKGFHMFPRASGFVSNPITNAATLVLIGCWSLSRLTDQVTKLERILIWAHLSLSVLIVLASRVRVGIVGFLCLFVLVALFSKRLRKLTLMLVPAVILLFLCTWYVFGFNVASIEERLLLLKNGWLLLKTHPFFGIGPDHFEAFYYDSIGLNSHPHNTVLGIAAETGLVGLGAYLGFMTVVGLALYRLNRNPNIQAGSHHWVVKSLTLVYLTYWVIGLADYNFADTELLLAHSFHFATTLVLYLKADAQAASETVSEVPTG